MSKLSRGQPVQTPGVESTTTDPEQTQSDTVAAGDDLPPDVQRLIDQRVAKALGDERRARNKAQTNPATGKADLPSQEEALAQVNKDPKRRAVLSREGWVTASSPVKERDESGFAKA